MQRSQEVTGTYYTGTNTVIGNVLAHIANGRYVFGMGFGTEMGYGWTNVASLIENQFVHKSLIYPDTTYLCTTFTGKEYDPRASSHTWKTIFDFQLQDAAVTYAYKAAESTTGDAGILAQISIDFFRYSAQLRKDVMQKQLETLYGNSLNKKNTVMDTMRKRINALEQEILTLEKQIKELS